VLNEFTLEVIRRQIEFSRMASQMMRESSYKFSRDDSFWSIYNGLVNIFQSYGESYLVILESEKRTEIINNAASSDSIKDSKRRRRSRVALTVGST
jgi:hypothetical protein